MNSLEKLKSLGTQIVADTGDISLIKKIRPIDVTTNPSLILKSLNDEKYKNLYDTKDLEELLVNFGEMILQYVKGYVSVEVNPNYSYNTDETVKIARKIIKIFEDRNINRNRILIKIATTWEGIMAAKILENENIKCNMTLIFSEIQALACAQNKVTLISPFVGRITDWYKLNGYIYEKPENDMGVISVKNIFNKLKSLNSETIVMGASFRNIDQIKELAGIDKLTISPNLIEDLENDIAINTSFYNKSKLDSGAILSNDKNHVKTLSSNEIAKLSCRFSIEQHDSLPNSVKNKDCKSNLITDNNNLEYVQNKEITIEDFEITREDFEIELKNNKMFRDNLENGIKKFINDTESIIKFLEK